MLRQDESSLQHLLQAKLAIVLSDNCVTLAGGVFKFLAVHYLNCTTGILDELLPLNRAASKGE